MKHIAKTIIILGFSVGLSVAQAGVVVVVSSKSPVNSLSLDQVSDIFLGKASRFPDGSQAVPIDQNPAAADAEPFRDKVTKKSASQLKAYWSKLVFTGKAQMPKQVKNGEEVKSLIGANPNMVGYIDSSLVDSSVKVVLTL
jgi:ABC-type phosphate transport system substrate-binding protein